MSYRSEYYLKEFENNEIKKLIIILNRIEIHNKKKYLLIVAKDLGTNKIVKLIDTHGSKHNLCKYSDDWALLNKGDVISVKCEFYKSQNCVNVLRIKSNYILSESIDLHESLKATSLSLLEENTTHSLMTLYPDLENIGKKHPNKANPVHRRKQDRRVFVPEFFQPSQELDIQLRQAQQTALQQNCNYEISCRAYLRAKFRANGPTRPTENQHGYHQDGERR